MAKRSSKPRDTNSMAAAIVNQSTDPDDYKYYYFARPHASLGKGITPAMAAGVAEYPWTVWDIAALLD